MALSDLRELRTVTVLFSDLSGFTAMSEQLDPEEVSDIVDGLFRRFRPLIESRGGTIDKFIGDAVMAVFGAPAAHEDDAARAVGAGLAMQKEIAAFNAERGLELRMRVGVHTGQVLWGSIGGARATATGDTVVVAQRLEATARPGTVHASHTTARAARRSFRFEDRDEVAVKGRPEPVVAFVATEGREAAPAATDTPFAGRAGELGRLRALWDTGRGGFVVVEGEAGVGKSRLAAELRRAVASPVAFMATGRAIEGARAPLALLGDSLLAGGLDAPRLAEGLAAVEPDPAARELMAHLLLLSAGVPPPGDRLSGIPPARLDAEVARSWTAWLTARAPALLVLEDLHAADEATFSFLATLPGTLAGRPVLVVATARPGRPAPAGFDVLRLDGMGRADAFALASSVLGGPPDPALADALLEASGGNPYFLQELSRHLLEEDLVAGNPVTLRAPFPRLPGGLEGLLVARLDALPATHREALKGASVIGRVFWEGLLSRIVEAEVQAALREAEKRDLVREEAATRLPADREFAFRHALLRDAAYSLLPKKDRGRLHAAAAARLEERAAAVGRTALALAARHREAAGQPAEAGALWLRAAREALAGGFPGEALGLAQESVRCAPGYDAWMAAARAANRTGRAADAHALLAEAARRPDRPPESAVALATLRAQVLDRLGRFEESLAAAEEALAAATDDVSRARAENLRGVALDALTRPDEALARYAAAEALVAGRDDSESREILANVARSRGILFHHRGRFREALESYRQARDIFGSLPGSRLSAANAAVSMANALDRVGRSLESLDLYKEAWATFREVGDVAGQAACLNNIGLILAKQDDWAGALASLQDAAALYVRIGAPHGEANARNNIAMALNGLGRPEEAMASARIAMEIRRRIGDRRGIASSHANLGASLLKLGRPDEAMREHETALAIRREVDDWWGTGRSLLEIANIHSQRAAWDEADRALVEAERRFRDGGAAFDLAIALRARAVVARGAGREADAARLEDEAVAVEKTVDAPAL